MRDTRSRSGRERHTTTRAVLAANVVLLAVAVTWELVRSAWPGAAPGTPSGAALRSADGATPARGPPPPPAFPSKRYVALRDPPPWTHAALPSSHPGDATDPQRTALEAALAALEPRVAALRDSSPAAATSNRPAHGANRGIEALVQALGATGGLADLALATGDADGDGRRELLDPWGRPLVFFSGDDYGSFQEVTGVGVVRAREFRDDPAGRSRWCGAGRFQLFSAGPDGRDDRGGGDDVGSPAMRD